LSPPGDDVLESEYGAKVMTHAITTLDDRELDAVYGGFTLNLGSWNTVTQNATASASLSNFSVGGALTLAQAITQTAIVGSVVVS
jgi:hypothetical protein